MKETLRATSTLIAKFFEASDEKGKHIEDLLVHYYSNRDKIVGVLIQRFAKDEKLAKTMVKISMGEFKGIASFLGMLGVLLNEPEFQDRVREALS